MSETKEESNSTSSDVKQEENSPKAEETKNLDESSKDSEKDSVKDDSVKEESGKDGSEKEGSDDDDDEEEMGLLDRPVEVTGCRARKQVERLEVSFSAPKEKQEFQEGKGQKLGDCPRIDYQIQKSAIEDLKPLHRILFGRVGAASQVKKSIRKFSGFPFVKNSPEFDRKKATTEKLTNAVLKRICEVLDLERGGTKEDIVMRILDFLLEPKDSGKKVPTKKKAGKEKKKSSEKKPKNNKKLKAKKEVVSDENDSANESASEASEKEEANDDDEEEEDEDNEDESDYDTKKKSKTAKGKKTPAKTTTKKSEKKEKAKKEEKKGPAKGTKRKRDEDEDESGSSEDEPIAKKNKMPSDEEIKKLVKRILDAADLQEITMKKVIKQVADAYPDCDLSHKKAFIKTTIKSVIS
ncbi:Protein DEK [Araneus ventricosus]|uniref:Protein DEK n=1 Tax=Araneus ventricosus TaxID=182803 RepID=A0A4Y2LRE2_ARAVE|nr:Protein DEK [Araneus ventricosus]